MSAKPPAPQHWSNALLHSLNDPTAQLISTDELVVIRDKYPKARHHYLILPRADIPSIYHLRPNHSGLLAEIELLASNTIELTGLPPGDFLLGYHAAPSMQRLHLHIISADLDGGSALRTRRHWNSFTTAHFRPMAAVHAELRTTGAVRRPPDGELQACLALELRCNRCAYRPKNMPDLKAHIRQPH